MLLGRALSFYFLFVCLFFSTGVMFFVTSPNIKNMMYWSLEHCMKLLWHQFFILVVWLQNRPSTCCIICGGYIALNQKRENIQQVIILFNSGKDHNINTRIGKWHYQLFLLYISEYRIHSAIIWLRHRRRRRWCFHTFLSVCLSVYRIFQKVVHGSGLNFVDSLGVWERRTD